jgi:hypothetical protein
MELEIKGTLTKIGETVTGTGKDGTPWKKLTYLVETDQTYNNLYAFEVFSQEKVEQFKKYNVVGNKVSVKFNVSTNEWKGKYFTTLQSWRCTKDDSQVAAKETVQAEAEDDLPF